jgi:hypothetical protein
MLYQVYNALELAPVVESAAFWLFAFGLIACLCPWRRR